MTTTETANDIYEKLTRLSRDIRDAASELERLMKGENNA